MRLQILFCLLLSQMCFSSLFAQAAPGDGLPNNDQIVIEDQVMKANGQFDLTGYNFIPSSDGQPIFLSDNGAQSVDLSSTDNVLRQRIRSAIPDASDSGNNLLATNHQSPHLNFSWTDYSAISDEPDPDLLLLADYQYPQRSDDGYSGRSATSDPGSRLLADNYQVSDPSDQTDDQPSDDDPEPSWLQRVWAWLMENGVEVLIALFALIEVIVRLTPTQKDDAWFRWVYNFIFGLIPNRKKGGGTHS